MKRLFSYKHVSIRLHQKARESLYKGIQVLSQAVSTTLGPRGKYVALDYQIGKPKLTKDGVTVAKYIELQDNWANLGAKLIKFSSHQSNLHGGDGTTTATILASAIVQNSLKFAKKYTNTIILKDSLQKSYKIVDKYIQQKSIPLTTQEQLLSIAKVATNNDTQTAEMIVQALMATGGSGNVIIDQGNSFHNSLIIREGYFANRGLISEYFLQDFQFNDLRLDDALILTADCKILQLKDILRIFEFARQSGKSLVLAANDFSPQIISTMLYNIKEQTFSGCAIHFSYEHHRDLLSDLSAFCGSKLIRHPNQISESALGTAIRVNTDMHSSNFLGGGGDVTEKKLQLQIQLKEATDQDHIFVLKQRIKRLSGKMAVIQIGVGGGQADSQEQRDRIVDALNSVKSSLKSGYLPGGASALFYAARELQKYKTFSQQDIGLKILQESLKYPLDLLARHSTRGIVAVQELWEQEDQEIGLNVLNGKIENLVDAGVIDSTWIVRHSLRSAVSVALMLLSTSAVVARDLKYIPTKLDKYKKDIF